MTMTATNRPAGEQSDGQADNVASAPAVRYRPTPDMRLPERPRTEIRSAGFLGLGSNPQDLEHARHMTEIYHLAVEVAYAELGAAAMEAAGVKTSAECMEKIVEVVYMYPGDSVQGMLAADMAGESGGRMRLRHARLADAYDAEVLNIVHKRRHY